MEEDKKELNLSVIFFFIVIIAILALYFGTFFFALVIILIFSLFALFYLFIGRSTWLSGKTLIEKFDWNSAQQKAILERVSERRYRSIRR